MNFQQIRAAVSAYLHRTDQATINNEPLAIELARVAIARSFHPREASVIAELAPVDGWVTLPDDYGAADAVLTADGETIYTSARDFAGKRFAGDARGFYTVTAGRLYVDKSVTELGLIYYARPVPLVADTDSSWLSDVYPDALIYRAIAEQHRFLQDWDQAITAEQYALQLLQAADLASDRAEASGGALRVKGR